MSGNKAPRYSARNAGWIIAANAVIAAVSVTAVAGPHKTPLGWAWLLWAEVFLLAAAQIAAQVVIRRLIRAVRRLERDLATARTAPERSSRG